ncbi:hypothetical protein WJX81_007517 [Elliptochloris bilobata]|uniref:SGNH hydrolase-type esterase domain-containing protein n=1 Tax=Elliptochloris bilobata TaxID=381761 RepID=A0AAW1SLY1_9CHLO
MADAATQPQSHPDYLLDGNSVLGDTAAWRYGKVPDYTKANFNFSLERTKSWEAGSLPDMVSNLVKNWEKEASYKLKPSEWRTIDPIKYRFSCNGGPEYTVEHMVRIGTYNALIGDTTLYSASVTGFEESHRVFRDAMPNGFPWEVTDVYSGPPVVSFKWRHWGVMQGPLRCPLGHGQELSAAATGQKIQVYGMAVAVLDSEMRITKLEIFYDPEDLLKQMVRKAMGTTEVAEDAPPPPPAMTELSLADAGKARSLSRPPIGASPIGRSNDYSSASGGAETPPLGPALASPLAGCPMLRDGGAFARAQAQAGISSQHSVGSAMGDGGRYGNAMAVSGGPPMGSVGSAQDLQELYRRYSSMPMSRAPARMLSMHDSAGSTGLDEVGRRYRVLAPAGMLIRAMPRADCAGALTNACHRTCYGASVSAACAALGNARKTLGFIYEAGVFVLLVLRIGAANAQCPGPPEGPEPRIDKTNWVDWQEQLASEVAATDHAKGIKLLWSGDSVLELMRGQSIGYALPGTGTRDYVAVYNQYFPTAFYNSQISAISGDYTGNLLWRIKYGGEMPAVFAPKLVVIYIGSNDLSAAQCGGGEATLMAAVPGIVSRVAQIIALYRERLPPSRILLVGNMPRGARYWLPEERYTWPNAYTRPLQALADAYQAMATPDGSVSYAYCGAPLASATGLRSDLLPDGIHPTPDGYRLILPCLKPTIDRLLAAAPLAPPPEVSSR